MSEEELILSPKRMFGRRMIYTNEKYINRNNIAAVMQAADMTWQLNKGDIEYLYEYYKGNQPSLYRVKEIRPEICNQIVENRAKEIVDFKTGYLCGSPIQYVSRSSDVSIAKMVDKLNALMQSEGKSTNDKELIEWQMICGTSYRMALPDKDAYTDDCPFELYVLDPRKTFVIYSNDYLKKPMCAVFYTNEERYVGDGNISIVPRYSVYTETEHIELVGDKVESVEPHALGMIPIIEYPANQARMGAFEPVISLLDALSDLDCNRLDGVGQFIQSLMILYNCQLEEDQSANTIRQKGLIELKSIGENKADVKILSEQLNQSETQTLKVDLLTAIREISGIPAQSDGSTSSSSNNIAMLSQNGWQHCEAHAKTTELMFKKSEQQFLKLVLGICRTLTRDIKLKVSDIDPHFTRTQYDNILSKSQVLTTLLATNKVAPSVAFQVCGLFVDPEEAQLLSQKYVEDLEAKQAAMVEAQPDEQEGAENEQDTDRRAEQSNE